MVYNWSLWCGPHVATDVKGEIGLKNICESFKALQPILGFSLRKKVK